MSLLLASFASLALAAAPKPVANAFPTDTTVTTADGKALGVSIGLPKGATNGVVFVHMAEGSRQDWAAVADKFYRQGVSVLTLDLRGHGAGGAATGGTAALTPLDWPAMAEDVRAGVSELRKRGAQKVALVGAELGANLALVVAAGDPDIASVALLSPASDYHGVIAGEAAKKYAARPIFLAASQDDAFSFRFTNAVHGIATGAKALQVFQTAGKGTKMLNREPTLESQLLGFVTTAWVGGVAPPPTTDVDVKVKTEEMETTGKRIGE